MERKETTLDKKKKKIINAVLITERSNHRRLLCIFLPVFRHSRFYGIQVLRALVTLCIGGAYSIGDGKIHRPD